MALAEELFLRLIGAPTHQTLQVPGCSRSEAGIWGVFFFSFGPWGWGIKKAPLVSVHKLEAFIPPESPAGLPAARRFCPLGSYQFWGALWEKPAHLDVCFHPHPRPASDSRRKDAGEWRARSSEAGSCRASSSVLPPRALGTEDLLFLLL